MDYDRALGELLELDATVRATQKHLADLGILDETLIVVTADHGHGFDVFGSADTKYLAQASGDRKKRDAIGTYQNSGLSEYQVSPGQKPDNTVRYLTVLAYASDARVWSARSWLPCPGAQQASSDLTPAVGPALHPGRGFRCSP